MIPVFVDDIPHDIPFIVSLDSTILYYRCGFERAYDAWYCPRYPFGKFKGCVYLSKGSIVYVKPEQKVFLKNTSINYQLKLF